MQVEVHCLDLPSFQPQKKQLQIYSIIYFIEYSVSIYIKKTTIVIIIFKSKLARSRHYYNGINKIKKKKKQHSKYRLNEVKVNLISKIV